MENGHEPPIGLNEGPFALGFSPCPNDTFMFDAWVHGRLPDAPRVDVVLDDIEQLNRRATMTSPLTITKLSVAAFVGVRSQYALLRSGAALGRGCGPLVVVPKDSAARELSALSGRRVAIPGAGTTAAALLRAFGPTDLEPMVMRFDEIMPAVASQRCEAGLIIHESRFTYPRYGLRSIADLGELWESGTGLPLPLGIIAVHRSLSGGAARRMQTALSDSIHHAWAHPDDAWPYVRQNAQELDDEVCRRHISLYVNEYSAALGDTGAHAVEQLLARVLAASGASPETLGPIWALPE